MQKVPIDKLRVGFVLPNDLYSSYGIRLLTKQTGLTPALIEHLEGIDSDFYLADSVREFTQLGILREVDSSQFTANQMSNHESIIGLGGRVTSEYADAIESHHLDALSMGAFETTHREPEKVAAKRRQLAETVVRQLVSEWDGSVLRVPIDDEFMISESDMSFTDAPWPDLEEVIRWRDARVEILREQFACSLAGLRLGWSKLLRVVDDLIGMYRRSPNHFPQIALLCPNAEDYLPDHALNTAVLAIGLAIRLNWSMDYVRKAGVAGLVHDLGMLLLPKRLRMEDQQLSEIDRSRIMRHPAYSVSMLGDIEAIDPFILCGVYQHHERLDGSGYPDGIKSNKIGELGRLLAVADMAAALNEPRPFRAQPLPCEAIQTMIQFGVEGILHRPLIRALVELIGLYPIGSYVHLSTDQVAQVIGQHADAADRPIISVFVDPMNPIGQVVDLKKCDPWEISIMTGCPPPPHMREAARMRWTG